MIEQTTIKSGIDLLNSWGLIGSGAFIFFVYILYSNIIVKKKAFDPITKILVELEKRPTYGWIEDKFQLKEVAKSEYEALKRELDDIKTIVQEINRKIT